MSDPFVRVRPGAFEREDPLAELARLVGKDDPFRAAQQARPAGRGAAPPAHDERYDAGYAHDDGHHAHDGDDADRYDPAYDEAPAAHHDLDAQLRGSLDDRHGHDYRPREAFRLPALSTSRDPIEPTLDHQFGPESGEAPPLNADLWAEGMMPPAGQEPFGYDAEPEEPTDDRTPRRTLIVLAAVLALTVGGLGATFLMRGGPSSLTGNGSAPTIMAAAGPAKIQSPDMTATGTSTEGTTALLEKTGSDNVSNATVINTQERPVDLAQLPKTGSATRADTGQTASSASPFPEPRKVKTILIRPDGSVVGESPAAAAAAVAPSVLGSSGGVVMPSMASADATALQPTAPATPAAEPIPVAKASTPKSSARVPTTPKATTADGAASGAKQTPAPVHPKPKPVVTADATPSATDTAPTAGTYAVQLAAPGTEQDAKDTASRLQKKFSGELGGLKPSIRKADSGTKSVYRVRVSNLSQDDAKSLCSRLQAGGGSCFVVRN